MLPRLRTWRKKPFFVHIGNTIRYEILEHWRAGFTRLLRM